MSEVPRDVVSSIADLIVHCPGARLVLVRRMPPGIRWCVDDNTIYIQADPPWSPGGLDLSEAIAQLHGPRPRPTLVAINGGLLDSPTVPIRAAGSR